MPTLYAVVQVKGESLVLAGTWLDAFGRLGGFETVAGPPPLRSGENDCWIGTRVASRFGLRPGDAVRVRYREAARSYWVRGVVATGAAEDNQILAELESVQALAGTPGKANVILARVSGEPAEVEAILAKIAARFPGAAVNALRQVTESEFRVLERIRGALLGTTLVVLLVSGLCVLATMTAQAFERRPTIGTLKAMGATNGRLCALFLGEAATLALAAAGLGFAGGVTLARWLGGTLFTAAVDIRWATLPLCAGVTLGIAWAGTLLPLRLVRETQPAVILRGE
jgi:putative ABC transport system permease protein